MPEIEYKPSAPLSHLVKRAKLLQKIRSFFDSQDFIEVQTPVLSRDTVIDLFVEPIVVPVEIAGKEQNYYLQTSPEFAMKRLVASGMTAIYQITPAFRKDDRGKMHNIEFSMLEWYRVDDQYQQGRNFLANLIDYLLNDTELRNFQSQNPDPFQTDSNLERNSDSQTFDLRLKTISNIDPIFKNDADFFVPVKTEEYSFVDIFEAQTGLNPLYATLNDFRHYADSVSLDYPHSFLDERTPASENDWIDLIFSMIIQPKLGEPSTRSKPFSSIILYDYPGSQSQLSQTRDVLSDTLSDQRSQSLSRTSKNLSNKSQNITVSERFELFVNGIELANGYHELRDPQILRERNQKTLEERSRNALPLLPSESRLLAAMEAGFPECCGCALGIDRLLMVLLNAQSIDNVIPFPIEIA